MTTHYLPHQQRVVEEFEQLAERFRKLNDFFSTDVFTSLDQED